MERWREDQACFGLERHLEGKWGTKKSPKTGFAGLEAYPEGKGWFTEGKPLGFPSVS
jgi:hypothetical protein